MKTIFLAALLLLLSNGLFAQFTVDGEFRSRLMINHGQKAPVLSGTDASFSVDQRSRLILNYSSDKYTTRFTLQDARLWGHNDMYNKTGVLGNSFAFGVYEAWFDLKIKGNSSVRIGRQEWHYNDMRLLSWRNWWTSGLSYDGLLYKMHDKEKGRFIDLGLSYNNEGTKNGSVDNSLWETNNIKTLNFLNLRKQLNEKFSVAAMFMLSGKVDTSNNALLATGTHGLFINYNSSKKGTDGIFASFSSYYQHGTDMNRGSAGDYKKISAYLVAADVGFRTWEKKLEVSAGMELISGHDFANTDTDYNNTRHSFDLHYGGRFPYYGGYMNHFLVQDSYKTGTKGGGYFDPYIKVNYKLQPKTMVNLAFFIPQLTTNVRAYTTIDPDTKKPANPEVDDNGNPVYWKGSLGQNIDVGVTHKFSKEVILKGAVSYSLVSDLKNQMVYGYHDVATKQLKALGQNYFAWMSIIVKPQFFSSK